jgi:hypothetical protein
MAGYANNAPGVPTLLATTAAVNFNRGAIGSGGKPNDTILNGIKIAQNSPAVTVTITGIRDSASGASSATFTGQTAADTWVPLGWLNITGPLTATASVANKAVLETVPSGFIP